MGADGDTMKTTPLMALAAALFLCACALTAPPAAAPPAASPTTEALAPTAPASTPTAAAPPPASPTPTAALQPTALPTPEPSPTPASAALSPENFSRFAPLTSYLTAFEQAYGAGVFDVRVGNTAFSAGGRRIAFGVCSENSSAFICSGGAESTALVLDAATGALVRSIPIPMRLAGLALSPDGDTLYTLQTDLSKVTAEAWDVNSGSSLGALFTLYGSVSSYPRLCLSPDGRFVAAGAGSLGLAIISLADNQTSHQAAGPFSACSFSAGGERLFAATLNSGGQRTGAAIFATDPWGETGRIEFPEPAEDLSASPDGRLLAAAHLGSVTVWDVETGGLVAELEPPPGEDVELRSAAFSPDGRLLIALLISYSPEGDLLRIGTAWEAASWRPAGELFGLSFGARRLLFEASGERFLVVDDYGIASLYSLPDENLLAARAALEAYLDALSRSDYDAAAALFAFDPLDEGFLSDWIVSEGGDPDDIPATLAQACLPDDFPCLPLRELRFAGMDVTDVYLFAVTLQAPDGTAFTSPDGESEFWLYGGIDPDGKAVIYSLPPGAFGGE